MELFRESQTSTNTSEVEESVEVRNTCNRSFLLSIRYFDYNFVSTTSPLLNLGTKSMLLQERLLDPFLLGRTFLLGIGVITLNLMIQKHYHNDSFVKKSDFPPF